MENKKTIIIISAVLILGISVFAFINFNQKDSTKEPLFRTQEAISPLPEGEKCIITVRGGKYDVTEFLNEHPGGNIFKCGEDMTEAFNKQHGEKQFRELQKYKINE